MRSGCSFRVQRNLGPSDMLRPDDSLSTLKGVGPKRVVALRGAGFATVVDLLHHLPRSYQDRRHLSRAGDCLGPGSHTFRGRLRGVRRIFTRRRGLRIVRGELDDESGRLAVVWFNQPYLENRVEADAEYLLHGELRARGEALELLNPSVEKVQAGSRLSGLVPVYPAIEGIGPSLVARLLEQILVAPIEEWISDPLPPTIRRRYDLPSLSEALRVLHRPGDDQDVGALVDGTSRYHNRLIYGELLDLRISLERSRARLAAMTRPHRYEISEVKVAQWRSLLPFELTAAQERALATILEDLRCDRPMQRLLQGDVGSGKTAVAFLALMAALDSGLQGAFMVPTELLAEQHFGNLKRLLPDRFRIGLFSSSSEEPIGSLANGDVHLAIGTHALIQEGAKFRNLGLAVVDEQQRFGVAQRRELTLKSECPDVLVMTATPIPRSLALTAYGDLDLSIIDELPPGRRPIRTSAVARSQRRRLYGALRRRLESGGQAYVVVPFVEASEEVRAASLEKEGEEIRGWLAGLRCGVVHGRMNRDEREAVMSSFAAGEIRVLLATTVIEVGIDVPAASYMVIESAERFGVAQLHQLRGRVGRGRSRSYCVAIHGSLSDDAKKRIDAFLGTQDGFEIAEADLRIRGPGDLLGSRQSGLPILRAADLRRDAHWLERATKDARELLSASEPSGG